MLVSKNQSWKKILGLTTKELPKIRDEFTVFVLITDIWMYSHIMSLNLLPSDGVWLCIEDYGTNKYFIK